MAQSSRAGAAAGPDLRRIANVLDDQEYVRGLLRASRQILNGTQKKAIADLFRHFCRQTGGQRGAARPKVEQTRNPWESFMLLEEISLDRHLRPYMENIDVAAFVNERTALSNHNLSLGPHDNEADSFMASYIWTNGLEVRLVVDRVRWFFAMLIFYDFVRSIFPGASTRIGPNQEAELAGVLEGSLRPSLEHAGFPVHDVRENIKRWFELGSKLNVFVDRFGHGCLFYLANTISENFLRNRFTKTGGYCEGAFAHLEALGLLHQTHYGRASELGDSVRRLLRIGQNGA
ncbi:hypothetical protein MBLNU459_g7163t1 [Dothideomycetes sp. NU459]